MWDWKNRIIYWRICWQRLNDFVLASDDAKHIAFKSGDLNERGLPFVSTPLNNEILELKKPQKGEMDLVFSKLYSVFSVAS